MNLPELKDRVNLELAASPQRLAKAVAGIDSIGAGIAELAALGYQLTVVEQVGQHAPVPDEFPKMLYRRDPYPFELTVDDEVAEADARKDGYTGRNDPAPVASIAAQTVRNSKPALVESPKPPQPTGSQPNA